MQSFGDKNSRERGYEKLEKAGKDQIHGLF